MTIRTVFIPFLAFVAFFHFSLQTFAAATARITVTEVGAAGDGSTINTAAIQSAIDSLSEKSGGTVVIPKGVFVSGALFLKPRVNLHLEKDAVLRATTDMAHFPKRPTRIEGQFTEFTPALINAEHCDGLRITGEGTLDGDGRKIWDEFWTRINADRKTRNLDVARARIAFIENSKDVVIDGPTFKNSQFWNLHLYHCQSVVVRNARFEVPDNYKQAPSTDGVDVDSSQDVLIEGCYFSVTDDCIALKGTKGPFALEDKLSPPVERVRIRDCVFKRGHAAVTLGSEATIVRDAVVENCRVLGSMFLLHFKLRPDTPQTYENIHYRDIALESESGSVISIRPWKQYVDFKGQPSPKSTVRNITLSGITGRYGNFGIIEGNTGQTTIDGILIANTDISLGNEKLKATDVKNFLFENVIVNGALLSPLTAGEHPASPHSLTVGEGATNPLGFYDAEPVLSWKLPVGVHRQTGYRIEVKSGGTNWDSDWVESEQTTFVRYGGKPFASRERVEWRVRFRDENKNESDWSETAHFELGLLSNKDWSAQWIRPQGDMDAKVEQVAWLRREFQAPANPQNKIVRARAYVTARGLFDLRINGARIGEDYFANGWTSYHKRLDTLAYDVTRQLIAGENKIEVMLGTGWFAGRLPFETKTRGPYGMNPEFLFQLEITREDGAITTIISDEKWEGTREGPILFSSIYDGESYDARKQVTGWKSVHASADLGKARLTPKPFPPVRGKQTLAVQAITQPQPGRYIFDLGQNMVGWARVRVPMQRDATLTIRFAEMLQTDGTLYTENYRTAKSTDTYTTAATGIVEWEPHFTFHGFRYVELSGLPPDAVPQNDWVTGVVLFSDLQQVGKFETSNAKLNQLQSNIVWGQRGNFLDIPTDCPQRDERAGWLGDAQVFCPTAMFNYDCLAFWRSWLDSMRTDQDASGRIPAIIPAAKRFNSGPGWIDAGVFIPWDIYVRTGDTRVLAENFSMMGKIIGWYRDQSEESGLLPKIKGNGDWLQPYPKNGSDKGDTPDSLVGIIFYARSAQLVADIARVLGRDTDVQRFAAEAARLRETFQRYYFDADTKIKNAPETQAVYVLALAFDLLPADAKPKAAAHLVRLIRDEAGGHLRTGFLGTPHIARVLDENGYPDLACELLLKETYPSWLYPINQGATTMWERWNSYSHEHGFGNAKMNSFNHYAYGAIGQWMYERIAGLAPDPTAPGYKHFFIRPLVSAPLDSARAEYETPHGKAISAWEKQGDHVQLKIVVPPNTTATVELPDGIREKVGPGTWTRRAKWRASAADAPYDARITGREILTPAAPATLRITGAEIFGVRPGKPILFRVSATGEKPVRFSAKGLPEGVTIDPATGWITGRAPQKAGDILVEAEARNAKGRTARKLTLSVGETICLTPPMGWNSWYVQSEGVSDKAIREIATAMQEKGLTEHGWTYLNIDDCWMGLRDPKTKAIQPNAKFPDMKALVQFVNSRGLKAGIYSTPWMSTYAGYIGGSSPNEKGDYSEFFLPEGERQNPHQVFGRYPNGIRKGLGTIGPVWFVDRDARQFAEWGIDYVKYDWKEWTLVKGEKGYEADKSRPVRKTEAVTKRLHDDFRAVDRDIIISLSPDHDSFEDGMVPRYCNLWRLTPDIHAEWRRIIAPFRMEQRLQLTGPGHYGDLDMLQIGPLGKPNRAEVVFNPSPLAPAEQYFQVTLWAILTQPLLLSCHIPTMDAFDLGLVTNDEVLAVNQDRLCKQGYRVAHREGVWEIWAKKLADSGKAVALFNLSDKDQVLTVTARQAGLGGRVRDLWRQRDIGELNEGGGFSAHVTAHGAAFLKVTPWTKTKHQWNNLITDVTR